MRSVILSQWRSYDGSDMTGLGSFNDSTSKRVLDPLETGSLRLTEFRMDLKVVQSTAEWVRFQKFLA